MESTKSRLIAHAATLFAKNGCKAITMDDIANSMGISKRTIYENFSDKKSLLEACLRYFFERRELEVKQILQSSDHLIAAIFKLLDNTSKVFYQLQFNLFNEIQKYYPETYNNTVRVYKQQFIENTDKLLQKGIIDGIVRKEVNPSIMAIFINEASILILHKDVFADYGFEKKNVMHDCMSCLTRGMFTEKGVRILDEHIDEFRRTKTPLGRYLLNN
jgi:AcrR family transcriptional regulator